MVKEKKPFKFDSSNYVAPGVYLYAFVTPDNADYFTNFVPSGDPEELPPPEELKEIALNSVDTDAYGNVKKYSVNPEDFAKSFAEKSDVTMDFLIKRRFMVLACDCGEADCQGWQMQTEDWFATYKELGLWDESAKAYKVKDIYLGESPEEYYALHYPDMDKETLELCLAGDYSVVVCTLFCVCGNKHEVEYTPPPHEWYEAGVNCACGRKVVYGE